MPTTYIGLALKFAKQLALAAAAAGSVPVALPISVGVIDAPPIRAQSARSAPVTAAKFEVASVKLSPDALAVRAAGCIPHTTRITSETRVDLGNIPLPYLIATAYRIKPEQVVGPDWMSSLHLDILANLPAGATKEQIPEMLQALLADRLGLQAHFRTTELPVYALVVGSKGASLKEATPDGAIDGDGKDDVVKVTGTGENRSFLGTSTGRFGRFNGRHGQQSGSGARAAG